MIEKDDEIFVQKLKEQIKNKTFKPVEPNRINTPEWRDPNDVKQYLENLYIEYSFQCMSEKRPDGCHRLANYLENIKGQYKEATDLYKKTCDDFKYPRSCVVYSKNCSLGRGTKQNLLEACRYSFTSCDLGQSEGCLNAGICLLDGVGGLPQNVFESIKYFNKACDDKNSFACMKLFKVYIEGKTNKQNLIERDPVKAYEYTKRACEMDDIFGCLNASLMQRKGILKFRID